MQLPIGEKTYTLSRFDEQTAKVYLDWVRSRLPDPVATVLDYLPNIPVELREPLLREALAGKLRPLALDAPEVLAVSKTLEGVEKTLCLIYQKHHPDLTPEQVWAIHKQAVAQHGEGYLDGLK